MKPAAVRTPVNPKLDVAFTHTAFGDFLREVLIRIPSLAEALSVETSDAHLHTDG
jgi:hypothetical protein